jgi:hypothetical protein
VCKELETFLRELAIRGNLYMETSSASEDAISDKLKRNLEKARSVIVEALKTLM